MPTRKAKPQQGVVTGVSRLTDYDIFLFKQGQHTHLFDKLGAHLMSADGVDGVHFALWAPNATRV